MHYIAWFYEGSFGQARLPGSRYELISVGNHYGIIGEGSISLHGMEAIKRVERACRQLFELTAYFGLLLVTSGAKGASDAGDVASDLPIKGRSVFDYLIVDERQNSKINVPYPFERLVQAIRDQLADPTQLEILFFPYGRSLQKFAADPNYFKYPRTVLSVTGKSKKRDKSLGLDMEGKLFIGYVEPTNQLEVISYNEQLGRYEFQIVKGYGQGKTPEVYYVKRKLCMSCHENAVPIFPGEPWSETNDNDFIAESITAARGGDRTYLGAPIKLPDLEGLGFSANARAFDRTIERASGIVYRQHRRDFLCPPSARDYQDCLGIGFKVAFANYFGIWLGPGWPPLARYKEIVENFYLQKSEVDLPFPFIQDRDPITNHEINSLADQTRSPKGMTQTVLKGLLKTNITYLQSYADPKKSRRRPFVPIRSRCQLPGQEKPTVIEPWCETTYFRDELNFLELADIQKVLTKGNGFDFPRLALAIDHIVGRAKRDPLAALASAKINGRLLYEELMAELTGRHSEARCCAQEPIAKMDLFLDKTGTRELLKTAKNPAVKKFIAYCSECHAVDGVDYPKQFLIGDSEVGVVDKIREFASAIRSCLENTETPMPPISSHEYINLKKNPADRQALLEFVTKGK